MNRAAAVARIQQGLSFRTGLTTQIIAAMQEAQDEFEMGQTLPYWLLREADTISLYADTVVAPTGYNLAGNQSVTLLDSFIRFYEHDLLHYTDDEGNVVYLAKKEWDEAEVFYRDAEAGAPNTFALKNRTLKFWPYPDSDYTLSWTYYAKAASVLDAAGGTDAMESGWLQYLPYRLIGRAGMLIAADLEHTAAIERFSSMYGNWTASMLREEAIREDSAMPRAMGRNK